MADAQTQPAFGLSISQELLLRTDKGIE